MKHTYLALSLILFLFNAVTAAPPETLLRELDFKDIQVEYLRVFTDAAEVLESDE